MSPPKSHIRSLKRKIYSLLRDEFRGLRRDTPKSDIALKLKRLPADPEIEAFIGKNNSTSVLDYASLFTSRGLFEVEREKALTYTNACRVAFEAGLKAAGKAAPVRVSAARDGNPVQVFTPGEDIMWRKVTLRSDTSGSNMSATIPAGGLASQVNVLLADDPNSLLNTRSSSSEPTSAMRRSNVHFRSIGMTKKDFSLMPATQTGRDAETSEVDDMVIEDTAYLLEPVTPTLPSIPKLPNMYEIEPISSQDMIPETSRLNLFPVRNALAPLDDPMHIAVSHAQDEHVRLSSLGEPSSAPDQGVELDSNGSPVPAPALSEISGPAYAPKPVEYSRDSADNVLQVPFIPLKDAGPTSKEALPRDLPTSREPVLLDMRPLPETIPRRKRRHGLLSIYKPVQPTTETPHATSEVEPRSDKPPNGTKPAESAEPRTANLDEQEAMIERSDSAESVYDPLDQDPAEDKQVQDASMVEPMLEENEDGSRPSGSSGAMTRPRYDSLRTEPHEHGCRPDISQYATMPIPQTHALYLPYRTQYKILIDLQTSLEEVCFDYMKRKLPDMMQATTSQWEIDCPESLELNQYVYLIKKHSDLDIKGRDKVTNKSHRELYVSMIWLRHYTVHRKKASMASLRGWANDAHILARVLGDAKARERFMTLSKRLRRADAKLLREKGRHEEKLLQDVKQLAAKRAELDRLEQEAMQNMVRETQRSKASIAASLEGALGHEPSDLEEEWQEESSPEPKSGIWGWIKSWFKA